MYLPKALVVYLLTFRSFRRSSSDVLSVKTAVFLSKVIHFPVNSLRVGVHGRVYGNIERSTYVNFNAPFLQKLQPGVQATRVHYEAISRARSIFRRSFLHF